MVPVEQPVIETQAEFDSETLHLERFFSRGTPRNFENLDVIPTSYEPVTESGVRVPTEVPTKSHARRSRGLADITGFSVTLEANPVDREAHAAASRSSTISSVSHEIVRPWRSAASFR